MVKNNIILAGILGLDLENINDAVFIAEVTKDIIDVDAFVQFCREQKDGIIAKPTAKLDTLATRYKKIEDSLKLPHDKANSFASNLNEKVNQARVFIKNQIEAGNQRPFSSLIVEGQQFFTDKELKALSELGSSSYLIALGEQNALKEELSKLFITKWVDKVNFNALSNVQKKVKKLENFTKKF